MMFMMFSPYSFLFFSTYMLFMFSLFNITNFYYYWSVMELMMLLFMGLSYTLFVSSYSQLMVYFLIQTLSSFMLLVFYIYNLPSLLTMAFLMKLSMFPFFMWYINLIYKFPNFMLWLASTLHKLPPMLMIKLFSLELNTNILWLSIVLTVLFSGVMMLMVLDLRLLLVLSSIGNNSWFLLSQMVNMFVFLFFLVIYSFSLFFLLNSFKGMSKPSLVSSMSSNPYALTLWVLSISGMPPFPVFFGKMLVILSLLMTVDMNYFFMLFLVMNSLMVMGYLQSVMKYFIYIYSSNIHYMLKY
uniref:NADH-ubiquinone oxidoreductase chain 2 n=1 Tax=Brachionus calyciflorus TaxID=104777 RepID=A0A6B9VJ13_9BILA|nr:NADH dehydrogenase subunit 2 [Brachionus calyciflorus]